MPGCKSKEGEPWAPFGMLASFWRVRGGQKGKDQVPTLHCQAIASQEPARSPRPVPKVSMPLLSLPAAMSSRAMELCLRGAGAPAEHSWRYWQSA